MIKAIEEKAEKILELAKVTKVPVDVSDMSRKLDIVVKYAPSTEFSGLLYRKDGKAFMAINSKDPEVRQRFTMAHELGHFFLHPQKDTFVEFRDSGTNSPRSLKEIQANQFAAALLMPRKNLLKDIVSYQETGITDKAIQALAERYQVSEESMNYRLRNLNSIRSTH
ncbi:ImmA/IrrE family metallo-endopeptidase [candidate division WS5 bacterium]|uniref:ImmA/IrrE family metallo-endopeptidase n=1 Tax=candidate division WS5 bacterium TaxID=2093353 RepID=A0A419DDL3_9BACT|nr:MAG: ImmA/IrrE family metallo-endopeptidase [candidate division WS5 bacterium]